MHAHVADLFTGIVLALFPVRLLGVLDRIIAALEALLAVMAAVLGGVGSLDVVSVRMVSHCYWGVLGGNSP